MYKVLIAEDEMLVRVGLKNSVRWENYGMSVIADVSNGKEAYDVFCRENPDVIITDLKMPGMDGMELIEEIRKKNMNCIIIILSCVNEFDCVRKAMSLNVFEYIFKLTMTSEEINNILLKTKTNLDMQKIQNENNAIVSKDIEFIKKSLLKEYILFGKFSETEFRNKNQALNLKLSEKGLVLCVLEVDDLNEIFKGTQEENQKIANNIIADIINILSTAGCGEVFQDNIYRYVILFSDIDRLMRTALGKSIYVCLNQISDILLNKYGAVMSAGVSERYDGYSHFKIMTIQAREAIDKKFILNSGIFFYSEHAECDDRFSEYIDELKDSHVLDKLLNDDLRIQFNNRITAIRQVFPADRDKVVENFIYLLQWSDTYIFYESDFETRKKSIAKMNSCKTLENLINIYLDYCKSMFDYNSKFLFNGDVVSATVNFIKNNYQSNLTLQQLSEEVSVSPSYLSNLFKKKLNINLIDYINNIRIEKAKELLSNTNLRSYEIAAKVGIIDTSYFSKVFKKYTGVSPYQYRKNNYRENIDI